MASATGGIPAADGAPAWPQYDRTARATLIIDHRMSVQDDPYPAGRTAWGEIRFDGSDPGLDRLTPLQYEGTPWSDWLVIAAVIGWPWVITGLVAIAGLLVGLGPLIRRLVCRRRRRLAEA